MTGSRKTIGLAALAGLALSLRIATVLVLRTEHAAPVTYEHGQIAENLIAGRGFSIEFLGTEGPTSQQAPFYPFLLAASYWCLGVGSAESLLAVQLVQCLAGTALVVAVVWLGWELAPDRPSIGWVAGIGAAVYPTHLYMVTHMQVASWAALLLTVLLAVAVSRRWRARWAGAVLTGVLAGCLLLIEPILAVALPVVAAAFWLGEKGISWIDRLRPAALGRVALMAAVAAAVVAPWMIRNRYVHGEFVFIKSTFGYAFWQANNPSSWGTDKIPKRSAEQIRQEHDGTLAGMNRALWEARHETVYIDDVLLKPTGYREFLGLTEPERSRVLGRRACRFIRAEPGRYLGLCLRRLRYFLLFDATNPKASILVYRATTVTWLALVSVGLFASASRWRQFWPTYAVFGAVAAFHALTIVSARFRIPVEPLSMVWAASAVVAMRRRGGAGQAEPSGPRGSRDDLARDVLAGHAPAPAARHVA